MSESTNNSSLPLLLSITGAVVIVAVGGWFYLEQEESTRTAPAQTDPVEPIVEASETMPDSDEVVADAPAAEEPVNTVDVEAELSKARLAAGADILVFPAGQSALHYYGEVLAADPEHEVAAAELETVLATVARQVSDLIAGESFDDAYAIATQVARLRPEHALVIEVQQSLDSITEEQVAFAIAQAQEGNDDAAEQLVVAVEALPGRNPDYITAVRESIEEIRQVRFAAERDRVARARLANTEAKAAWVDRVNTAISVGNLITPAGASARDLLLEQNDWAAEREQLTASLVASLGSTAESFIESGQLADAETLLDNAAELTGDSDQFQSIRDSLEQAFVAAESARILNLTELVALNSVPARYPPRAEEKGISGWVDVYFTVTPSGETANIEVTAAEPQSIFDRAAINAVEKWLFEPVEFRGQVISQRAAARLKFELQ
ncbi:MAG: energy transducer TonB [Gammaproteobacteria bacterium]|nr:energy transducer TonB [Gammaproteobacteria bacterium]